MTVVVDPAKVEVSGPGRAQARDACRSLRTVSVAAVAVQLIVAGCGPVLTKGTPLETVLAEEKAAYGDAYRLQPGDQMEIHHVLDSDYSAVAVVAPDGRINVPGIPQPVLARGQTVASLSDELNRRYRQTDILKDPFFSINLRSFASLQVFIGGEVLRPGFLETTGGDRSALQVIMAAGGFANTAKASEVIILRTLPNGKGVIFSVNLEKVLDGEDLSQNVPVRPMDVVFVPKSNIASLDAWVDQFIRQALPLSTSASITLTNQSSIATAPVTR